MVQYPIWRDSGYSGKQPIVSWEVSHSLSQASKASHTSETLVKDGSQKRHFGCFTFEMPKGYGR